jgi:hypothetical protein
VTQAKARAWAADAFRALGDGGGIGEVDRKMIEDVAHGRSIGAFTCKHRFDEIGHCWWTARDHRIETSELLRHDRLQHLT